MSPSAYIRGDAEINRLRSGDGVGCEYCGATPGNRCANLRDSTKLMLYNHPERRRAGKLAADALVVACGRSAS